MRGWSILGRKKNLGPYFAKGENLKGLGPAQIGAPSFAEALLLEARSLATERLGDLLGRDHSSVGYPVDKDLPNALQMPTTQGYVACPVGVAEKGSTL